VSALYTRYGFLLQRRARILLRDNELAADAVQETFIKVLRNLAALDAASAQLGWLYRVLDRTCIDFIRRRRLRPLTANGDAPEVASRSPEGPLNDRDFVLKMLHNISEEHQQLSIMAFVDGMSQQEIGDELGLSRVTINKRVGALRTQLLSFVDSAGQP
jgi:RNA polymerase sigma factor (sigma-70 family)